MKRKESILLNYYNNKKGGPGPKKRLPIDYNRFLEYNKTAPENRQAHEDWQYGNPDDYDHYGMWDALGKPKNFQQALEMNPDWQPDPYDGSYHGGSVNPNTGVFLKSYYPGQKRKPGSTTWMEVADFYKSSDPNWNANKLSIIYDPELKRLRYVPKKQPGGDVNPWQWVGKMTGIKKNPRAEYVEGQPYNAEYYDNLTNYYKSFAPEYKNTFGTPWAAGDTYDRMYKNLEKRKVDNPSDIVSFLNRNYDVMGNVKTNVPDEPIREFAPGEESMDSEEHQRKVLEAQKAATQHLVPGRDYRYGGLLDKYQSKGQVSYAWQQGLNQPNYSSDAQLVNKIKADLEKEQQISRRKAEAKRTFIGQGKESTPYEKRMRDIRNKTYASQNAPYARVDEEGNLSRSFPNVSMTGVPDPRSAEERMQKGMEHMGKALEYAGYLQGAGALAPFAGRLRGISRLAQRQGRYLMANPKEELRYMFNKPQSIEDITSEYVFNREKGMRLGNSGLFNEGVYQMKRFPGKVGKVEKTTEAAQMMGWPEYADINLVEATKGLPAGGPLAKVYHQFNLPNKNRVMFMDYLKGKSPRSMSPTEIKNIPRQAYEDLYNNIKTLRNQNLAFDFVGDNYAYDPVTQSFKIYDINLIPNIPGDKRSSGLTNWVGNVLGGGDPSFGYAQSGENLKRALIEKLKKDYTSRFQRRMANLSYKHPKLIQNISPDVMSRFIDESVENYGRNVQGALKDVSPYYKQGGFIPVEDQMGQWAYPGLPTRIRGKKITMDGVNGPLVAKTNRGITKLLLPNMKYEFEPMTQFVDEHPVPNIPQISNQTPMVMRNFGGEEPPRYLNLSLPKMKQKRGKVGINPYIYYERPNANVNIMGAGFQGNTSLGNRWDLMGGMNMGRVSVPRENFSQFLKPSYNLGLAYRFGSGGQHGGLDRWFAEKWVDVKTGKACGRQEGENRAYPACRPSKRISSQTPKTSSEMSSSEKAKFKNVKQSSQRIPYNHKRR